MFELACNGKPITSKDHRIVQAIVMWAEVNRLQYSVKYPKVVNKSWPQFWDFIKWSNQFKGKRVKALNLSDLLSKCLSE